MNERNELQRIVRLAWPVTLTSLNWTAMQVTDVIVVGFSGTREVAALGASRALTFVAIVTVLSWCSGVLVFASRADGAGDLGRTGGVMREGLLLGLALGLGAMAVLLLGAGPLLRLVGVAPELLPRAGTIVRIMALAFPFQLVTITLSFFLEGISRPRRVTAANLVVLPVNALLAWAWAGGHAGLPAAGAAGAAAATVSASALATALLLLATWRLPRAAQRGVRDLSGAAWRAAAANLGALVRFGIVPAIASGLELAGFSILIGLSTGLGDDAAHAFQIVFSVHNVCFASAFGLGSAAGVRAGNAVGEGRPQAAVPRTLVAVACAAALLGTVAAALALFAGALPRLFPATPHVHALASAMLVRWAPFIVFDGMQVVLLYALRSLGDQVAAGINSVLAYFIVTGGVGLLLVHHGAGPMGLVWASGAGMLAAAALHGGRFAVLAGRLRKAAAPPSHPG